MIDPAAIASTDRNLLILSEHSDFLQQLRTRIAHTADETLFLSSCAAYLERIEAEHRELRQEQARTRDELEYVRAKWRLAVERTVELEDRLAASEFAQQLAAIEEGSADGDAEGQQPSRVHDWRPDSSSSSEEEEPYEKKVSITASISNPAPTSNSPSLHRRTHRAVLIADHFAQRLHADDFDLAAPVCRHIVAQQIQPQPPADTDQRLLAAAHELLAMHDRSHQRYAASAVHMQYATIIFERMRLPPGDFTLITTLSNLALLHLAAGQPNEARIACTRALQLRRDVHGAHTPHRSVARQLHNLAIIERRRGDAEAALLHYGQALEMFACATHAGDPNDPQPADDGATVRGWMVSIRDQMVELYGQRGRYAEAAVVLKRWLAAHGPAEDVGGTGNEPPIWQRAEELESLPSAERRQRLEQTIRSGTYRRWWQRVGDDLRRTVRRLGSLYRTMGMVWAAELLERQEEAGVVEQSSSGGKPAIKDTWKSSWHQDKVAPLMGSGGRVLIDV